MTDEPRPDEAAARSGMDELPASWRAAADLPSLAMVESSALLPGLLPLTAWERLQAAEVVVAFDPGSHPLRPVLTASGITVQPVSPHPAPGLVGRDLLAIAPPVDEPRALAVLDVARSHRRTVLLLPPDDDAIARAVGVTMAQRGDVEVEWVFLVGAPRGLGLLRLVGVLERLLDPDDGCPWDLEQTHQSLAPHLVEEAYEAVDAISTGDDAHMAEELGDVLLQVVFHAGIAARRGAFDVDDVAAGISAKLERRHPHVFGDEIAADADEVRRNWDAIKAAEKPERSGPFDGIVEAMPSLPLTHKVAERAARIGWRPDEAESVALVRLALADLAEGRDAADAIGRLGVALVTVARAHGVDAEVAVRTAAASLVDRFEAAARRADRRGVDPSNTGQWQALLDEVAAAGF